MSRHEKQFLHLGASLAYVRIFDRRLREVILSLTQHW